MRVVFLALVLMNFGFPAAIAMGDQTRIYYGASNAVEGFMYFVDPDTGINTQIYSGPSEGRPIAPAVFGKSLYWSTYYPGRINLSNLDGSGLKTLVDQGSTTTRQIEFDSGYIYWSNEDHGIVYRTTADFFENYQVVLSGEFGYANGFWDINVYDGKVFWTSWDSPLIHVVNLDGSGRDDISIGLPNARAFSLEVFDGRLFVSDTEAEQIVSTLLDGTDLRVLVTDVHAVGMDIHGGRLYFNNELDYDINSILLDGSDLRFEATTDRKSFQINVTTVVLPNSVFITRGILVSGGVNALAASDGIDLSIQRGLDVQSRTVFELTGVSPVANPVSFEVELEGAVFARSSVNQTIELFDFVAGNWQQLDSRAASPFSDSTVIVAASGDLARFVELGTRTTKARISYNSLNPRQQFSSNTDHFSWAIE